MRAIRFHEHGGENVLSLDELDRPEPADDELLVENRAAGINHVDTLYREGIFTPPGLPAIPGSDFAGVVAEVGDRIEGFAVGDRVHGAGLGSSRPGTYAEYVTAPRDQVAPLPDGVSFEVGAAMGHVGVAAWHGLIDLGEPNPGDVFLVHGGGGGVGHIAVQLAADAGMTVITTESAESTRERLLELGADVALDFRREDLEEAILEIATPTHILDYFFDLYLEFDIENVAPDGHISVLEYSTEEEGEATIPQSTLRQGILKDVTIQLSGIYNADILDVLPRLTDLYTRGRLDVLIAGEYDLEDAAAAHRDIVEEVQLGTLIFSL